MFFTQTLQNKAADIIRSAEQKGLKFAFAESCTGGLLSALFTEISGSSQVFERSFIVYSNEAKQDLLDVKNISLSKYGAVSAEVALEMAEGALRNSKADFSVAITGIAGPCGALEEKPVGLVYIAYCCRKGRHVRKFNFFGDRADVRKSSIIASLEIINSIIEKISLES